MSSYRYWRVSIDVCKARRAASRASSVGWGFGLAAMIVVPSRQKQAAHAGHAHPMVERGVTLPVRDRRTPGG